MLFIFVYLVVVFFFVKKYFKYILVMVFILGSMVFDFEYFLYFRFYGVIGYIWFGFLYLNLLFVFLIVYIYYYILKKLFIMYLFKLFVGYYLYVIDERWGLYIWKEFFVFCYFVLLGMFMYVVWDVFIYNIGYFVMKIVLL